MTGHPVQLLEAIAGTDVTDLVFIGNNLGEPGLGGGLLLRKGKVKKAIGSFFTSNREAVQAYMNGTLEVELLPQGSLAEAIRAGGAGLGGFFTPAAAGTDLAKDRETRILNGTEMVFVEPIHADVALLRAWKADTAGNLQYRLTENNFNQAAAMAATTVIVEVEHIVAEGELAPEAIHTPGCLVDFLVQARLREKDLGSSARIGGQGVKVDADRLAMARAALEELQPGDVVNLGVGIPTLVADLLTPAHQVILQSENGMLGMGPKPASGGAMTYPINAGKIPVTALPGTSYFDSAMSFALIRGGHVDATVIGGLQVDEQASLANWAVPGKPLLGVGGAMDLAVGARRLIVTMTHTNKAGEPKIVPVCTLPVTGRNVVDVLITELAVFRFIDGRLTLVRVQEGCSLDEIREKTSADYRIALD